MRATATQRVRSNTGAVGEGACQGVPSEGGRACLGNAGSVAREGACIGPSVCKSNTGAVGEEACVDASACEGNAGQVSKHACQEFDACEGNRGIVGENSCVGTDACRD